LYSQWPWRTVRRFDRRTRLLTFEKREKLTRDREPIVVQPYACWRISLDALPQFARSAGDEARAERYLTDLVWDVLDRRLAEHPLIDWLNPVGDTQPSCPPPQATVMAQVTRTCQQEAYLRFGLDVLDVQLQLLTRPERMKKDLVRLMRVNQQRGIDRLQADADLQRARLEADVRRRADQVLAGADAQASQIRSQGDREAQMIEADARRLSPELTDDLLRMAQYVRLLEAGPVAAQAAEMNLPAFLGRGRWSHRGPATTPATASAPSQEKQ
jgi:membrane protease subunit HflC